MSQQYLFICGCPRSGTTVLGKILSSHHKIALGIERYLLRVKNGLGLTKSHFEYNRFFNYQAEDSHFSDLDAGGMLTEHYTILKKNYLDCKYFGDKIPSLYQHYHEIFSEFPKATVLFIYRNLFDVCQSYNKRYLNPKDGWEKNVNDGISDWNISLNETFAMVQKGFKILPISYENLFDNNREYALKLLKSLDLEITQEFFSSLKSIQSMNQKLEEKRNISMNSIDKKSICLNGDFESYKQLDLISNKIFKA